MTYKFTDRDFETPDSDVGTYYRKQQRDWDRYDTNVCFGYFDEEGRKPAMILKCGVQNLRFNVKTAYLLREMLKRNPELLDHFIDGWLLENASALEPSLGSSGSNKPKRRAPTRHK